MSDSPQFAEGGIIPGGPDLATAYDPDVDGPIIHPDTVSRSARREVDRLNDTALAENDPHPLNEATPSRL